LKLKLEKRNAYTVGDLALADFDKSLAAIEGFGRFVGGPRLHDRASRVEFCGQNSAHERDTDAASEERRVDGEPVDVDRLAVELPRRESSELIVDERAEEVLAAPAERVRSFHKRRNRDGSDQTGFDAIRAPLDPEDGGRDRRVGDVKGCDGNGDGQSLAG
jgi:hypothetical protein